MRRVLAAAALLAAAHLQAHAVTIGDLDLTAFAFDVTSYDVGSSPIGSGGDATASGTSGSLAWSISPTSLWSGRTTTDGSFHFAALPVATDNLHPGGDYTITFSAPVKTLLVALSNDNTNDSINFGLLPVDSSGVTMAGTQVVLNSAAGGLVLFDNVNSLTIHNVDNNGINDGYDLAFWAVAAVVPEPTSAVLLVAGLAALGWVRRKQG
jgi:hypothetical protein